MAKLAAIHPWSCDFAQERLCLPLVAFMQGGGETAPELGFQLPQLCKLACRGYVVATVSHRCIFDGASAPA